MRFVSGTASGAALVVVGHPLDTLRVLLQTSPPGAARETSLVALSARLLRAEGVRGFYRGFAPPLLLTGLVNTLLWGLQFSLTDWLEREHPSVGGGDATTRALLAAAPASVATSLVVAPIEGIKTRQQTRLGPREPALAVVRSVMREEGARGLFRGLSAVALTRLVGGVGYFGSNAAFKAELTARFPPGGDQWAATRNVLLAGGFAGICCEGQRSLRATGRASERAGERAATLTEKRSRPCRARRLDPVWPAMRHAQVANDGRAGRALLGPACLRASARRRGRGRRLLSRLAGRGPSRLPSERRCLYRGRLHDAPPQPARRDGSCRVRVRWRAWLCEVC